MSVHPYGSFYSCDPYIKFDKMLFLSLKASIVPQELQLIAFTYQPALVVT